MAGVLYHHSTLRPKSCNTCEQYCLFHTLCKQTALQCSQASDLPTLTETRESDRQAIDQSTKPISSKDLLLPPARHLSFQYNLKYQHGFSDFLDILLTRIPQRTFLFFFFPLQRMDTFPPFLWFWGGILFYIFAAFFPMQHGSDGKKEAFGAEKTDVLQAAG